MRDAMPPSRPVNGVPVKRHRYAMLIAWAISEGDPGVREDGVVVRTVRAA